jgi:hypothetical protein
MQKFRKGSPLIFMKIGTHAQEPLDQIVERKRRELNDAGRIFWGYGGNTCHPQNFVHQFASEHAESGREIHMVMQKMNSNHLADPKLAEEYSNDGVVWRPVPKGIQVRGSRYAMVLQSLEEADFRLNLGAIRVACGRSRGQVGTDYLRGRVDKGCFEVAETVSKGSQSYVQIGLVAKLAEPYAVFLR